MPDFRNQGGRGADVLGGSARVGDQALYGTPGTGRGSEILGGSARPGAQGDYSAPVNTMDSQTALANGAAPAAPSGPSYFNGANWQPTYQNNAGYNPSQYATLETANTLVGAPGSGLGLGGNVIQTSRDTGPFGVPQQTSIDFGGDSPLNAGLLAERYKKYDHATADAMTRAELALQGPKNWSMGDEFGAGSQWTNLPGGNQNAAGGQNIGQFVGENAGWRGPNGSPGVPANPTVTNPVTAPAPAVPPATPTNPLAGPQTNTGSNPLLQLLSMLTQQSPQNYNRYGNSRYYPNLPRTTQTAPVQQMQNTGFQITPQQLLSLLLGF